MQKFSGKMSNISKNRKNTKLRMKFFDVFRLYVQIGTDKIDIRTQNQVQIF